VSRSLQKADIGDVTFRPDASGYYTSEYLTERLFALYRSLSQRSLIREKYNRDVRGPREEEA
jgi:hypothetical protein